MEAVAAVSSIAGILSLVGQALNGVMMLRGLWDDCASASDSISLFMKRLNDLMQCLQDVEILMTKIRNLSSQAVSDTVLASLQIQLDDCRKDIYIWLGVGRKLLPDSSTAAKAVFKKFLVALEKQKVKDIYQDMLAHKDNINTKLSVIGRCFDIDHSAKFSSFSIAFDKFDEKLGSVDDKLDRLWGVPSEHSSPPILSPREQRFSYAQSQNGSMSSLMSIAESVARIESLVMQKFASPGSPGSNAQRKDSIQTAEHDWTSRKGSFQSDTAQRFTLFDDDPNSDLLATAQTKSAFPEYQYAARDHPLYRNVQRQADGLYHCPWEGDLTCSHRPEKLKCNYDKFVDSHLKPYKCKLPICQELRFPSTACLLRHEREAHGMHLHARDFRCTYEDCERSLEGNGFPRSWNLRDHLKRVHNDILGPERGPTQFSPSARYAESQKPHNDVIDRHKYGNQARTNPLPEGESSIRRQDSSNETLLRQYLRIMQGNETDLNIDISNYVDLVLLAEIIDCKISFLKTTPPQLLGYGNSTESEIAKLEERMHIIQREKSVVHSNRWNCGLNTVDLDLHLTASMKTGAEWFLDKVNMDGKRFQPGSPSTLPKEEEKDLHLPPLLDANKQDHINMWLFDILKVSGDSRHLHRKFLSPTVVMDDVQWGRQVLKYWLLDEAATGLAHETESTNGAVNSAGECNSIRVMIEESKMADHGEQEKSKGRKRTREESVAGLQRNNGVDAGSTTSSVPIRLKKSKYAESV